MKMFCQIIAGLFCLASLASSQSAFPGQADLVKSLPGVNFSMPYKQYSGYLELSEQVRFHYWLFESQSSHPERDPVVQWLNGGPTISSLYGAFTAVGPIRMEVNGSLTANPFAWNLKANLLVIESPVDVGFSYQLGAANYSNTDNTTAHFNFEALRQFFVKFPHLLNNRFYLTGQSYAGRYIPQLSVLALQAHFPPNFTGVAIGNGLLDGANDRIGDYLYYHGITDDPTVSLPFTSNLTNVFNILADCVNGLMDKSKVLVGYWPVIAGLPDCDRAQHLIKWFNRRDVRDALNIDGDFTRNWIPFTGAKYEFETDFFASNMTKEVKQMVDGGLRVIIYNGDLDARCNVIGARDFVEKLGYQKLSFDTWIVDGVIGGYRRQFAKNLTFTTVRGAGHCVPEDRPAAGLKVLNEFLLGE